MLAAILAIVNSLVLRNTCQDIVLHSNIRSNDTIMGGEFSACQAEVLVKLPEDDERPSVPIAAYSVYCNELPVYHDYINKTDTLEELKDKILPLYDGNVNSSYFAHGINFLISAKATIDDSNTDRNARVSVCWSTTREDYDKFLNGYKSKTTCELLMDILECDNGTKSNNVSITNTSPGYYFIGLKVELAVTSLWYSFTAVRSFYSRSDLGTSPNCKITHLEHQCEPFQIPDKKCVMLYADPQRAVNSSVFHPLQLNGNKETDGVKHGAFIGLWVAVSVILLALSICTCVLSFFKCRNNTK